MNINPFDFLKNFQNMQSQLGEMQEKMKDITVSGASGGGMVTVTMNGQMQVLDVSISPEAVDPAEVGMLEDLVLAAFTDAFNKVKDKLKEEISTLTGGAPLPPGFMGM
ncbi:MAG: YbaB/EbfC family nucleoid-associated protein [Spirochaetia bacterium]